MIGLMLHHLLWPLYCVFWRCADLLLLLVLLPLLCYLQDT
jgi:hypothetical protein